MVVLSPFIPVLCHSDWLFHGESCPRLDVVHPGRKISSGFPFTKNRSNRLNFNWVTQLLKKWTFFGTQCKCIRYSRYLFRCILYDSNIVLFAAEQRHFRAARVTVRRRLRLQWISTGRQPRRPVTIRYRTVDWQMEWRWHWPQPRLALRWIHWLPAISTRFICSRTAPAEPARRRTAAILLVS